MLTYLFSLQAEQAVLQLVSFQNALIVKTGKHQGCLPSFAQKFRKFLVDNQIDHNGKKFESNVVSPELLLSSLFMGRTECSMLIPAGIFIRIINTPSFIFCHSAACLRACNHHLRPFFVEYDIVLFTKTFDRKTGKENLIFC